MIGAFFRLTAIIISAAAVQPLCALAAPAIVPDAATSRRAYAAHVAEAARKFAIPEQWIWAVMAQESGGDAAALSRAGAMGLMQIMPPTWHQLRARLALGASPFDPRDNILAGAAYLREMYERYGTQGMLAAYNAGPGRYEEHVRLGRPLPAETQSYLRRLLPLMGGAPSALIEQRADLSAVDWSEAALFPVRAPDPTGSASTSENRASSTERAMSASSLFVARTGGRP